MSTESLWQDSARQWQASLTESWAKMIAAWPASPLAMPQAPAVQLDAARLQQLQQDYLQQMGRLCSAGGAPAPLQQDRRFAAPSWQANPIAALTASAYLLNAQALTGMAEALQADDKTRQRVRFAVEQWVAAMSPSNFLALNPEAQELAKVSQGASIQQGLSNLLHDLRQGQVSMTDASQFEVGRNVATTEGAVIFENELFQLIEYRPLTARVHVRPLLLVPPCINKYYILDLQPDNSLIRYAVSQGMRTMVVSWRNPDASLGKATWDQYIEEAVLQAIAVTQEVAGGEQINALGFCVGGTMLSAALAVLAARGESPVASVTLLTTLLDFSDTGVLDVFIDEAMVRLRELQMGQGGLLSGRELASTFNFLRPNELVWNYVVGNYLKGEKPPAFDLLYWNSDATNLPGPWYAWYLRHLYLENQMVQPGRLHVCGQPVDLGQIQIPAYIYGSREDHIVPIGAAYASTQHLGGDKRFVQGASGHIAGVINPPARNKRSYWVREDGALPATVADWEAGAQEHAGSWWGDWAAWLKSHAGRELAAPRRYGRGPYREIEPAPGRYVQQKA